MERSQPGSRVISHGWRRSGGEAVREGDEDDEGEGEGEGEVDGRGTGEGKGGREM